MNKKLLTHSLPAFILIFCMMLGMCSTAFASVEDRFIGDTINYVSLGASNVNGYGLDGYLPDDVTVENKNTANVYGYKRIPEGCYVDLVRDELAGIGYNVNVSQLAMSSMRVEELRILLDEDYNTFDKYTNWRFTGGARWFDNAGGLDALRTEYKEAIEDADLITVDIGVNNFGVYLSNQLSTGGRYYDDDLSLVDPELGEVYDRAKAYVKNLISEYAQEYADELSELDFVVDAMAYAYAGFCVNYDKVIERIYELNPDAEVVAVSIQNLMEGLEATIPGIAEPFPFGDLFGALVDAANLYIAIGSPYCNDYVFADVSENGRVEFFLDQLLSYNGNPETLDKDMTDCFDIYDNDLFISARIEALPIPDAIKPLALNVAHDVVAEIMQLGAKNNILDLATVFAGGYGDVEDGLLSSIESEVMNAIANVVTDPTYTYTINEDFFNDIADAAFVPRELVKTVATLGIRTGIGNSFYGHPNRNGHNELKTSIINALENETYGSDVLKNRLGITAEDEAKANRIIATLTEEVREIVYLVENGTEAEQIEKINEYYEILKEELNITDEDEAIITEFIENFEEILNIINTTSKEEVEAKINAYIENAKATVEAETKKLGHKKFEATPDSYYLAIGGDTVRATNVGRDENTYYEALAEELGIENGVVTDINTLLPSEVLALIEANAEEIEKADLITYQADASSFIYSILTDTPDWNRYIDAETQALINEILRQTSDILTADWVAYADAEISEILPAIKAAVVENLPAEIPFDEATFDALVAECVGYIRAAITVVSDTMNTVDAEIRAIDETVLDIAENLAYAFVAYAVDTAKAIDTIKAINPDATLLVLGMYNPLEGLRTSNNGTEINVGEYFEYVIDATNLYYLALAAADHEFAFVDISSTEIDGFSGDAALNTSDMTIQNLSGFAIDALNKMNANANGHEYIKEQILKAFVCDYSVYEQLNETHHLVKCVLCGDSFEEAHTFADDSCEKCGYTKPLPPAEDDDDDDNNNYRPSYFGGGASSATEFVVKFETNGGSSIASVIVKKDELLKTPEVPTKKGFYFDGWYTDKELTEKYDFSTPVTKSFTLYAKWSSLVLKFLDLDANAWYYEYVKTAVENGLMNGVSEDRFDPNGTLTRAMFVTILYRAAGEPGIAKYSSFTDVAENQYYANAVAWASENGIVNGVSANKFAPDAAITREQMAAIVYRYGVASGIVPTTENDITYTDVAEISAYAQDAAKWAYNAGIILGNADGSFAPARTATRAEAATIFVRLISLFK